MFEVNACMQKKKKKKNRCYLILSFINLHSFNKHRMYTCMSNEYKCEKFSR